MDNNTVIQMLEEVFKTTEGNVVTIAETGKTITLFDPPLVCFSTAQDPLYQTFKEPQIIGPRYMTPPEWMPEAKSVISILFPFSEEVRASTREQTAAPSMEWLYGRVEGHAFMQQCMRNLAEKIIGENVRCCIPTEDPRYTRYPRDYEQGGVMNRHMEIVWSERHAAYVCGHGTFGLSRCLISGRGTAHRLISCVVDAELTPTPRNYSHYMEYCTRCGACISRCPVKAISQEYSKNNILCGDWNNDLKRRFAPRYGCGACATGVPCECGIPQPVA